MTTATPTTVDVAELEIEIVELIAAYRECQMNAKAWDDERGRVRPVLEQKMAERGTSLWECEHGKALYIDAKGAVDWEKAWEHVLDALISYASELPFYKDMDDPIAYLRQIWSADADGCRKPAQRRFEVRAPLKIAPSHDTDDLAPALEASVTALAGKE